MSTESKRPKINLAAPTKEQQAELAAMPDAERRALLETEILKGFAGTPRKVTPQDTKSRVLKKLAENA